MTEPRPQVEFNLLGERFLGQMFILVALGAALFGVFKIMAPYLNSIVLAALVAYVFHPLHKRISQRIRRPSLAAFLSCTIVALLIIIPTIVFAGVLVNKGTIVWEQVQDYVEQGKLKDDLKFERLRALREKPPVKQFIDLWEAHLPPLQLDQQQVADWLVQQGRSWGKRLAPGVGTFVGNIMGGLVGFVLMFFVMFYFFRDGEQVLNYLLALVPLSRAHEERLVERVKAVSRSAVFGTIATAAVQGVLAMIGFAVAGVPWLFWGVVAGFAAMVPVVGAALVWFPAAIILVISGHYWQAIFLVIWGGGVISVSDNFLRPYFMKGDTGMSSVIAFFAILGGLQLFGLLGVVYGPLIVGVCAVLIYIFRLEKEAGRESQATAAVAGDFYGHKGDTNAGE